MLKIQGVPFSAHTRKVIAAATIKNIPFEVEPVIPFKAPPEWKEFSPLQKIPVVWDGETLLNDSSVICAYLERKYPQPSIYPSDLQQYAKALWLEEFVDGGLSGPVLEGVMRELQINPKILGQPTRPEVVKQALEVSLPPRFAYLERQIQGEFLVGEQLSIADITVVSMLSNFQYAGGSLDAAQYPRLTTWLSAMQRRTPFSQLFAAERPLVTKLGLELGFLQV